MGGRGEIERREKRKNGKYRKRKVNSFGREERIGEGMKKVMREERKGRDRKEGDKKCMEKGY